MVSIDDDSRKLLRSQLRDERASVKDAIAASEYLAYLVRGQRSSVNLQVANEARSLAKRQLEEYAWQVNQERDRRPEVHSRFSASSYARSGGSSPRPGPPGPPDPPPSAPLPASPTFHPQTPFSATNADPGAFTVAADKTSSGAHLHDEPGTSTNTNVAPPSQATHPAATDFHSDVGHRTARTLDRRTDRGSRVRDADRNVVWRENHHDDD